MSNIEKVYQLLDSNYQSKVKEGFAPKPFMFAVRNEQKAAHPERDGWVSVLAETVDVWIDYTKESFEDLAQHFAGQGVPFELGYFCGGGEWGLWVLFFFREVPIVVPCKTEEPC